MCAPSLNLTEEQTERTILPIPSTSKAVGDALKMPRRTGSSGRVKMRLSYIVKINQSPNKWSPSLNAAVNVLFNKTVKCKKYEL